MPAHARQVYDKYGQGLFTVTMEGREAKHIALQNLSANTTYQNRWTEIFRHKFIMLVWLPEQHHETCSYTPSKNVYIPQRVFNDSSYCYFGLHKADPSEQSCCLCGDHGRFPFNKNHWFKFPEFSLVEWNASDRFPEFEVLCSVIQGMLGVFENGGLFKHFRGFRGG